MKNSEGVNMEESTPKGDPEARKGTPKVKPSEPNPSVATNTPKTKKGTPKVEPKVKSKGKVYVCQYCGKAFDNEHALRVHIGMVHGAEREGVIQEPIIKSPKEELEEWFISELERRLPRIVGKQKTDIIIETIRENPDMIWDPAQTRHHIIQLAPRNISTYLLDLTLSSLYKRLDEYKRKIEETFGYPYSPIIPPREPLQEAPYPRVYPPREYGYWYRGSEYNRQYYPPYEPYEPNYRMSGARYQPRESTITSLVEKLIEKLFEKAEKEDKEKLVEVPNPWGEGTIKVPESQMMTYLMMKSVQDQVNTLKEAILKNQEKPKEEPKEPTVKIPMEDGSVIELPASQAVYHLQIMHEKEKRKETEKRLEKVEQQMLEMSKSVSPDNILRAVEQYGYKKYSSPTYDLINKTRQDINTALDRIFGLLESQIKRQMAQNLPNIPETGKYTPEERQEKIKDIKQRINKAEKLAKLEKEIVETVEAK